MENTQNQKTVAEILRQQIITTADIQILFSFKHPDSARKVMREIKEKNDRLGRKGKVHIQDYFDAYNLDPQVELKKAV